MSERFLPPNGPAKRRQLEALREHVAEQLAEAEWLAGARTARAAGGRLVGIGGTVRNLAAAAQRAAGLPTNGVQGTVIGRGRARRAVERLAALPAAERADVPGIKPARADLILAGAVVVQGVLRAGGFDALEATEAGLREGVFFERLLDAASPTTSAAAVRRRAPRERAEPRRRSTTVDVRAHAPRGGARAGHVRRARARCGLHDGDPRERELLWAASMLHDIGMSVDYDDHHKHSRYLILNAGLPGFTPVEVAIIAQAARYHRKGMPDPGPLRRCSATATASAWTAARCCCASPRISSARATSSCEAPASSCTTARSSCG